MGADTGRHDYGTGVAKLRAQFHGNSYHPYERLCLQSYSEETVQRNGQGGDRG